jgi:uncharacterized repeat protein (TIGR03803 family)
LIAGANGSFYGTLGTFNRYDGGVYMFTPPDSLSTLYTFRGTPDGEAPAGLILGRDGNLYGTTSFGGTGDCSNVACGAVFEVDPNSGQEELLYSFTNNASSGSIPGPLVQGADGNFYGTASGGQYNESIVYQVTPAGAETVLWSFSGAKDCVLNSTC